MNIHVSVYNWCEIKVKMWILNLGKPIRVPVLNEQQAIDLGADILGETVLFSILSIILLMEYIRQAQNEEKKKAKIRKEKAELDSQLQELYALTQEQSTKISELASLVMKLSEFVEKQEEISAFIKSNSHIAEGKSESKKKSKSPPQSNTPVVKKRKRIKKKSSNTDTDEEDMNNFRDNNGDENNLSHKCNFQRVSSSNFISSPCLLEVAIQFLQKEIYQAKNNNIFIKD